MVALVTSPLARPTQTSFLLAGAAGSLASISRCPPTPRTVPHSTPLPSSPGISRNHSQAFADSGVKEIDTRVFLGVSMAGISTVQSVHRLTVPEY